MESLTKLKMCISGIRVWMIKNTFKINDSKTFSCERIFYIHTKYFIYILLFLLDIVPYIVVIKLFVNKGISKRRKPNL